MANIYPVTGNAQVFDHTLMPAAQLFGLSTNALSPAALAQYIEDPANGLNKKEIAGEITVGVEYQPTDILISREIGSGSEKPAVIDGLRSKYKYTSCFLLSFSKNGEEVLSPKAGFSDYSNLLRTLSFQLGQFVTLTTVQGDTLAPINYYLDRTYHMGGSTNVLIAFPLTSSPITKLHIREFGLGCGNLEFTFQQRDFAAVPTLKYQ